jgi:hypothetical protein
VNRAQRRAAIGAHPRPPSDLLLTALPGVDAVFIGLLHSGHVRLDPDEARELAARILELAGDAEHSPN